MPLDVSELGLNIIQFISNLYVGVLPQVSIYVAVAHQTSHLAPDTRITTNDSSQTAKLRTAYSF